MLSPIVSAVMLIAGMLFVGIGIEGFLIPAGFIDGGVTGISMLLSQLTGLPLGLLLVVVNSPFLVIADRQLGRAFAVRSALAILGLAICLALVPFPVVTTDKLLAAVFGGVFIGAGVGLAIRGGSVLDGTEVLAVVLSRRTFATVGEIILALNAVIFLAAAFVLSAERALYSVLTYFAAFKTIDYLLHGIESYNSVTIFSAQHESIRVAILEELRRGVTVMKAVGGYSATEQHVLYCVVTRLELGRLESLVKARDGAAFLVVSPVHEVSGGMVRQRGFH